MADVDQTKLLEEISNGGKAEAAPARPATNGPPLRDMTDVMKIASASKEQVERVTQFILTSIEAAEERLRELKNEALADCARLKGELDANVVSAEAMARQTAELVTLIEDIRTKRAKMVAPGEA